MDLFTLDDDELKVLVGFVKLIVHADRVVSAQERGMLRELHAEVGPARWNLAVHAAREAYPTVAELQADARAVRRPRVRQLVHDVLLDLADADELIEAEAAVVRWVVAEWGVDSDVDEGGEDYVLVDPNP
ncbi:MAG: hypothetical protein KTR31_21445 [Myxococcales bacterium]|nr:hypothetical protein [Myxococcales bacterium]